DHARPRRRARFTRPDGPDGSYLPPPPSRWRRRPSVASVHEQTRSRALHGRGLQQGVRGRRVGRDALGGRLRGAARTVTVSAPAAPIVTPDRFYAALRRGARSCVWFFFKRVDVRHAGRVPATGPVLLCINHPNNLIDSLLVGAVVPRKVHYLATATLFRNRVLARFLLAAGAIPVYRRQDAVGPRQSRGEPIDVAVRAERPERAGPRQSR